MGKKKAKPPAKKKPSSAKKTPKVKSQAKKKPAPAKTTSPAKKTPAPEKIVLPERLIVDRFWSVMLKNQEETERQLEESERKFDQLMEERNRFLRESDSKFNKLWQERNRQLNESQLNIQSRFDRNRQIYRDETRGGFGHGIPGHGGPGYGGPGYAGYGPGGFGPGGYGAGGYGPGGGGYGGKEGKLSGKAGREQAIALEISKQFEELNFRFDDVSPGGRRILDPHGNIKMEIGTVMESTDCIMVIDTIAKPDKNDIDEFTNKLLMFRDHRDKYHDRRKIHGAITGKSFKDADKKAVLEAGFFTIEQGGGAMKITAPPDIAREF
jgi:hypothetical protein